MQSSAVPQKCSAGMFWLCTFLRPFCQGAGAMHAMPPLQATLGLCSGDACGPSLRCYVKIPDADAKAAADGNSDVLKENIELSE